MLFEAQSFKMHLLLLHLKSCNKSPPDIKVTYSNHASVTVYHNYMLRVVVWKFGPALLLCAHAPLLYWYGDIDNNFSLVWFLQWTKRYHLYLFKNPSHYEPSKIHTKNDILYRKYFVKMHRHFVPLIWKKSKFGKGRVLGEKTYINSS